MKKITQLSLAALTIAICFAACTKDNSSTTQPSVKFTSKTGTALKLKDTIAPAATTSSATTTTTTTTASQDTIAPR